MFNLVVSQRNTFLHFQAVRTSARLSKRRSSAPPCFKTLAEPIDMETPRAQVSQALRHQGDSATQHEAAQIDEMPTTAMPERVMKWSDAEEDAMCTYPDDAWANTTVGSSSDSGSTVAENEQQRAMWMLKNLPGRVTQEEVLQAIAQMGFGGLHDYFYMPTKLSGNNYVSRGYAFIGFADFEVGDRFREVVTGFQFPGRRSTKRIEVSPARLQSLEDIEDHFKSSNVVRSERGPMIGGSQGSQLAGQSAPAAARFAYADNHRQWQQQSLRHATPATYGTLGFQASGGMVATGFNHFGAQQCYACPR